MHRHGVWTIAGFDPAALAGVLVDVATITNFGVQAGAIVTSITAQSAHSLTHIEPLTQSLIAEQCRTLQSSFMPKAIKVGMLGSLATLDFMQGFLADYSGVVVLDPVLATSFDNPLYLGDKAEYVYALQSLYPYVDLLTPNLMEAEAIASISIQSTDDLLLAAEKILALGVKSVLIKGGHSSESNISQDFFSNGNQQFFVVNQRVANKIYRGTGCSLSSAIAACLALDYAMADALVNASAYVHRGIRQARDIGFNTAQLFHGPFVLGALDKPYLAASPVHGLLTKKNESCNV